MTTELEIEAGLIVDSLRQEFNKRIGDELKRFGNITKWDFKINYTWSVNKTLISDVSEYIEEEEKEGGEK